MHKLYASIHLNVVPVNQNPCSPWPVLGAVLISTGWRCGINSIRLFCKFVIISCTAVSYLQCKIWLKTCKIRFRGNWRLKHFAQVMISFTVKTLLRPKGERILCSSIIHTPEHITSYLIWFKKCNCTWLSNWQTKIIGSTLRNKLIVPDSLGTSSDTTVTAQY